ncbi:MAG: tyrosine-type recombinase/integrase, partial [Atribacterota bacterium]
KEILNKKVHPHMLRHSFGYEYINATGDLRSLQTHLGHSNPNTTQIYAQMSDEKLQENYNKFLNSVKTKK